jgi:hypothetical protein
MTRPFDPWAMCANCKDVHRESERNTKPSKFKGLSFSHCPKCNALTQAPRAEVPKQREIFEVGA